MGPRAASVRRAVLDLLLRPVAAAAAVAVIIVLPLLVVGEISDAQARARAQAEMFEVGAGVAERAGLALQRRVDTYRSDLARIASGNVRAAIPARNEAQLYETTVAAFNLTYRNKTYLARRVAVTNAVGDLLYETRSEDQLPATVVGPFIRRTPGEHPTIASFGDRRDPIAVALIPSMCPNVSCSVGGSEAVLSAPYPSPDGDRTIAFVSVAAPIYPSDQSRTLIGLLVMDVPIEVLQETVIPLAPSAEDIYVVGKAGTFWFDGRSTRGDPLADLSQTPLIAKSMRLQPASTITRDPVTLREYAPDPFSGAFRAFSTAFVDRWQIFVVPDQTPLRNVEGTLTQLRLARLGLGTVFVFGAFLLASAARSVSRSRAQLARSLEQQTATADVLRVISGTKSDLHDVFEAIIGRAWTLCHADHAWIWREAADLARVEAYRGNMPDSLRDLSTVRPFAQDPSDTAISARAFWERRPVHVPDLFADPEAAGPRLRAVGARSALSVPLLVGDRVVGIINLVRVSVRPFTEEEIALAKSFADQAVIAIENVRLFNEIQEKSTELEAASRHKSEFLTNMSHELRTPLNAVIGFSDVLEQKLFGELNERQAEYVRDISSSGKHLLDLVNEILDLSKVEAGRMELEKSDFVLADTIHAALAFVRDRAARHRIQLAAEVPADLGTVTADERKIRQVLLNLLSNAVKFTPDGGWIGVAARRDDAEVRVSVRDTGIGIAPEDQPAVFEEFRQVGRAQERSREGTGLGLTLAKRFVELHAGRIWLESDVGKGSTFSFALPVLAREEVAS